MRSERRRTREQLRKRSGPVDHSDEAAEVAAEEAPTAAEADMMYMAPVSFEFVPFSVGVAHLVRMVSSGAKEMSVLEALLASSYSRAVVGCGIGVSVHA